MTLHICVALGLFSEFMASAPGGSTVQGRVGPPPYAWVKSPEEHPNGMVSFRIWAPNATAVTLEAGELIGDQPNALKKYDEENWSVTVRPKEAGLFQYRFSIDGVPTIDPVNSWTSGNDSLIFVPGKEADFFSRKHVPQGALHFYYNPSIEAVRRVTVYTPPGYFEDGEKTYPVMFLLHGSGCTDASWTEIGMANVIVDNLIAAGLAKPMILVMPYGHTVEPGTHGWPFVQEQGDFVQDFTQVLLPWLKQQYHLSSESKDWAMAGFSMGGYHTLKIGLNQLAQFGHLGVFSWGGGRDFFQEHAPQVLTEPQAVDRHLQTWFIACGTGDFLFRGASEMSKTLADVHIEHSFHSSEGGHSMANWRRYLYQFAQMVSQD
jgi:enterochelin esterase-like enzyme